MNALEYTGIATIDPALFDPRPVSKGPEQVVRMTAFYVKEEEGQLAKPWKNMTPVKKGELMAYFNSGRQLLAPDDGFIIMPAPKTGVGQEWFYFGVRSDYFEKLEQNIP